MLTATAGGPKGSVSDVPGCPLSPGQVLGSPLGQLSAHPGAALLGAHSDWGGFTHSTAPLQLPLGPAGGVVAWLQASGLEVDLSQLCQTAFPPRGAPRGPSSSPVSPFPSAPSHTWWAQCLHSFTARRIPFDEVRGGRRSGSACSGTFAGAAASYFVPDCSAVGFPTSHSHF